MPKLRASSEELKGLSPLPEGMYTFRLDGFKPRLAKKGGSVNLNPQLKVINHADFNDRIVFENLNTKAKWVWKDFCHGFGVPLLVLPGGEVEFPGDFVGPEDNPESWNYVGPILGQHTQAYVVQVDDTKGGVRNAIKYYVCKIPGCQEKHSSNLAK